MPTKDEVIGFAVHGLVQRWLTLSQACEITGLEPRQMGEILGGHYKQMEEAAA